MSILEPQCACCRVQECKSSVQRRARRWQTAIYKYVSTEALFVIHISNETSKIRYQQSLPNINRSFYEVQQWLLLCIWLPASLGTAWFALIPHIQQEKNWGREWGEKGTYKDYAKRQMRWRDYQQEAPWRKRIEDRMRDMADGRREGICVNCSWFKKSWADPRRA